MLKRITGVVLALFLFCGSLIGCGNGSKSAKIGVSFGVGAAVRWTSEQEYMEAHAKELGCEIEVRLNKTDEPKTQQQDCFEMIDSGIDVLVLTPRDVTKVNEIIDYAKEKNVPVISYARLAQHDEVDLFVGYDCNRMGQRQSQYLTELVFEGDYLLLRGDPGDNNAILLYEGAMRYLDPLKEKINIIADEEVAGWDPALAKQIVMDAVKANGNQVDAILAPNDGLAGAAAEALAELGITEFVPISGMDAELSAAQRIAAGTQGATLHMDLQELSEIAIDEAYHMATKQDVNVNAQFENANGKSIPSNLITGQLITKDNLDKALIDSGYFTKEEVYGK